MKLFKLFIAFSLVTSIALVPACNTSCKKCTMGTSEHDFCKSDYASTNEWNAAVTDAITLGMIVKIKAYYW